jgi:hypothetical protein
MIVTGDVGVNPKNGRGLKQNSRISRAKCWPQLGQVEIFMKKIYLDAFSGWG